MTDKTERPYARHRDELRYLLCEAAELEHGLMCCYLFAAFSLKRGPGGDLTANEREHVEAWHASILAVAIEEMLHLALVQNLLASVGAAPHFERPNLPVSEGIYPSGVVLSLRAFDEDTLEHFIFLERPEGVELPDSESFEPSVDYVRGPPRMGLTASAQDYATVGALYKGIETSFSQLSARMGEPQLFIGDPRLQVGPELVALDGLHAVTDLASARRAIERIIEQGEGGRGFHQTSHYERFCKIRAEYRSLRAARGDFEPAHPVAANPVMNRPLVAEGRAYIEAPQSALVLDLANASYGLMIQLLAQFFCHAEASRPRKVLIDSAIGLMSAVVGPLARLLVTLPVGPALADRTAGISFTMARSMYSPSPVEAGWVLLHERAVQIAEACERVGVAASIAARARAIAEALATTAPWHADGTPSAHSE